MIIKGQNKSYQDYYKNIFNEIHEVLSDKEALEMAIEMLKIARDRLDSDLDNDYIKLEYYSINNIINHLDMIKELYK